MASYIQGYDEERFVTTVNRNFLCLICFNVLKDPVLCSRNKHCFCCGCITKHLENSQRCPTCADELTEETLAEPPIMIKYYLSELNIRCVYNDRGCQEIVQLQHLDQHEDSCGFTPAVCRNQGCGVTLNKPDLIHHESELCEYRKLKCHSCGEMTKTLADMEKRLARIETNQANVEKNMETKLLDLKKGMEKNTANLKTDIEGKLEVVNNEVNGLKAALIERFDEMKDVLVKMDGKMEEKARKVRNAPSGDRENIIVAGGEKNDSVEMFNWRQRTWSPLQSVPEKVWGATSFVYNNQVFIAGGAGGRSGYVDNMIRMNVHLQPDLSAHWSECPARLPTRMTYHSSDLYDDKVMVTGGCDANATFDRIDEVQLVPPYTVKTLSRMPEPRRAHCTEIFDDNLLIIGGRTTGNYQDNLSSVVLYDIKNNVCKQLAPLPYEVSEMATVRWGDNVVVIGGIDKRGFTLNKVIMYNVNTEQSHMLPPMKCKRWGFTAVVVGNSIVVLGGKDGQSQELKSVESFNFEHNTWQELPEMSRGRWLHTAVVV